MNNCAKKHKAAEGNLKRRLKRKCRSVIFLPNRSYDLKIHLEGDGVDEYYRVREASTRYDGDQD